MATLLLLTYALRNADCHAKNVALLYTRRDDVHLAPAYDMITTAAYPDYAKNPPGIAFMGKKTWDPGKNLQTFISATFGLPARDQVEIVDRIAAAMTEVGPQVRLAMKQHPGFVEIGKRMLMAWHEGMAGLRGKRMYGLGDATLGKAFAGLLEPKSVVAKRDVVGRSDLLGRRG
jgi:serine/threonine-protein kinase HipA